MITGRSTSPSPATTDDASRALIRCTTGELLAYFFRVGTFGFGGPIALAGYMQRDLKCQQTSMRDLKTSTTLRTQIWDSLLPRSIAIRL